MTSRTPWEDVCAHWVRCDPQAFLDILFHQAVRFCHELPREQEVEKYEVDGLMEVEEVETGERFLLHHEFQTYRDGTMAERMLLYNVNALLKHKKPVLSVVWHLMGDTAIVPPPLVSSVPLKKKRGRRVVLAFDYIVFEVGKKTPRQLRALGHPMLLPFIPLTRGGTKRKEILAMFENLEERGLKDLQTVGLAFAALKLQRDDPAELEWLQGRFYNPMLQEILRESPFIQWFIADEREKGLEEGLEKGREEGRAEGQAEIVEQIVRLRFPELVELSQQCLAGCSDLEKLGQVAVKLAVAQQVEEAHKALLGLRARPKRGKQLPPS